MPGNSTDNFAQYAADTKTSQFMIQAFASGLMSSVAHSPKIAIRDWSGDALYDPKGLRCKSLRVRINPQSFDVLDELPDKERRELYRVMHDEVLQVSRFPEIVFDSDQIDVERQSDTQVKCDVRGTLTLHGVSMPVRFSTQVVFGVDTARAYGDFKIRQTDFEIKIASVAGGSIKLQDEVKCTFYILARRQVVDNIATG